MPDSADPPRKKKRAKRPEPDFVIDPANPNKTIELETADLLQLGQSGELAAAINRTRELQLADIEELREGMPVQDPKIIVDLGPDPDQPPAEPNVFVDLGPEPEAPMPPAPRASSPIATQQPRASSPMAAQQPHRPSSQVPQQHPITPMAVAQQAPRPASQPHGVVQAVAPVAQQAPLPSVIVEPQPRPPTPIPAAALVTPPVRAGTPMDVQRVTPRMPSVDVSARSTAEIRIPRSGGMGLVVFVYLVAAAALGVSIYLRFFT